MSIKMVAVLNRSAGNESVGDMWLETKVFDESTTLLEVLKWAHGSSGALHDGCENFRGNLRITVAQT